MYKVKVKKNYTLFVGPKAVSAGTELEISKEIYDSQAWKVERIGEATPKPELKKEVSVLTPEAEPDLEEKQEEDMKKTVSKKEKEDTKEDVEEKQILKAKNRAMMTARTRAVK